MANIEFYRHQLGDEEFEAVREVLNSLFLTTGPRTAQFEKEFAEFLNTKHALGLMSCTHALELAVEGLGISAGDEVIVPSLTFMATANAVARLGGTPVFADCEADTGLLCARSVESLITKKTKAIIPVHLYGALVDMHAMRDLADRYTLKLIEDAAHCIEGERDGYKPGQLGDAACFSFYATKNLTCGEGGAISTNHDDLAAWLRSARIHGMSCDATRRHSGAFKHYDQEFVGTKANMNDLQAALLLPQMKHIATRRAERERLAHLYETKLQRIADVDFPKIPTGCISAYHLQTAWVPAQLRDTVVMDLRNEGIGAAVNYRPVHTLSAWKNRHDCVRIPLPNTERICASTITLPLYPGLRDDELNTVVDVFEASLHKAKQQIAA